MRVGLVVGAPDGRVGWSGGDWEENALHLFVSSAFYTLNLWIG